MKSFHLVNAKIIYFYPLTIIIIYNLMSIFHASMGKTGLLQSKLPFHVLLQSPYTSLSILATCPNHLKSTPLHVVYCLPTQMISLVRRHSIFQCHITHPPFHHIVLSLQRCQILFFQCPDITTIVNNIPDMCQGNVTFCMQ